MTATFRHLTVSCVVFCLACGAAWTGDKKDGGDQVASLIAELKGAGAIKAVAELADLGPKAAKAVGPLVKLLDEKNEDLRLNAALALSKIGPAAVGELRGALDHKDEDVRFYAVWSLGWIGPPAKEAAGQVVKLLADPSANVRRKAAFALGKIAPEPDSAIRSLLGAFNDKSPEVRLAAADAVAQFKDKAVPVLKEALGSKDAQVVTQALKTVELIGTDAKRLVPEVQTIFLLGDKTIAGAASEALAKIGKEAIDPFKEGLKSDRPEIQILAINGLAKVGAPAAPDLVDMLAHPQVEVRRLAAQHLANMRIPDRMVVLGLAHALKDKDEAVVNASLRGLQMLGAGGKEATPKLLALIETGKGPILMQALYALQSLGSEPKEALPVLIGLLERKDRDRNLVNQVFNMMPRFGPEAVPAILSFLKSDDAHVRLQAANSLSMVPGDLSKLRSELEGLLKDESKDMRRAAVAALGRAGEKAVPALRRGLKDAEPQVRWTAAQSIRQLGEMGKPALEDLTELALKDGNSIVRRNATFALSAMGSDGAKGLAKVLGDSKDYQTQVSAVQALGTLGEKAAPALDALIDALKLPQPVLRWSAANALGTLGAAAKEAIPALQAATKDANPTVRGFAMTALTRIQLAK